MRADELPCADIGRRRATPDAIYSALKKLASPLVEIFLRFGITRRDFQAVIDEAYVEAALRSARSSQRGIVSEISLRTGIDRKKVGKLLAVLNDAEQSGLERGNDAKSVILAKWHSEAPYCDANGQPKPLTKYGPGTSIRDLVDSYGGEIKTGPLVDQMLSYGILKEKDGKFVPVKRAFLPGHATNEQIAIFGTCTSDFLQTMLFNLHIWRGDGEGRFQNASIAQIPKSQVAESEAFCRDRLHAALLEIDQYLTIKSASNARDEQTVRFGANANVFMGQGRDKTD